MGGVHEIAPPRRLFPSCLSRGSMAKAETGLAHGPPAQGRGNRYSSGLEPANENGGPKAAVSLFPSSASYWLT